MVESLLFIGAGAEAGEKNRYLPVPRAGQKWTGSATLAGADPKYQLRLQSNFKSAPVPAPAKKPRLRPAPAPQYCEKHVIFTGT